MKLGLQYTTACLSVFLCMLLLLLPSVCSGLVLHTDDEPTDKPPDNVVGRWRTNASCVVISPNHVLTVRHAGGSSGTVQIGGTNYTIAQISNIGSADLRVVRITTADGQPANLPDWVPLYRSRDEKYQTEYTMGGFGKGRGETLYTDDMAYGYAWAGSGNTTQRWGANKVNNYTNSSHLKGYISDVIWGKFSDVNHGNYMEYEAAPADHDSGGGWFIKHDGVWKVAGLFRAVEHWNETWFRLKDDPNYFHPDYFDAVRISSYHRQITAEIPPWDDFNDNRRSSAWLIFGDDHSLVWVNEANQRLEIRAAGGANSHEAVYASNEWKLNSTEDFSLKVNFHHEVVTEQDSWLFIRLATEHSDDNYISFEAGCDANGPYWLYEEIIDGEVGPAEQMPRDSNDGTLYISYDAGLDELYLSCVEYGSEAPWQTIPGLLQGQWMGKPVCVHIGGGSNNAAISSGKVYLDNFAVNSGVLLDWPPTTDINGDGYIDWLDIGVLSEQWLEAGEDLDADINGDNKVNFKDFAKFADVW